MAKTIRTIRHFFSSYSHFTEFLTDNKLCVKNRMGESCSQRGLIVTTMCRNWCFLPEIMDPRKNLQFSQSMSTCWGFVISGRKHQFWHIVVTMSPLRRQNSNIRVFTHSLLSVKTPVKCLYLDKKCLMVRIILAIV